jgi:tRNA A-37 threonylcarbamoyl transferase component Bud32
MFVALSQAVFDRVVKDNAKVYNMSKGAKRICAPCEKGVTILYEWSRNTNGNIFVCYTVFVCKNPRRRSKKNHALERMIQTNLTTFLIICRRMLFWAAFYFMFLKTPTRIAVKKIQDEAVSEATHEVIGEATHEAAAIIVENPETGDEYIIETKEVLGKGTFGKIFLAKRGKMKYAMKIQKKGENPAETVMLREVMWNLNCVQMLTSFEDGLLQYIVFEKLHQNLYETLLNRALTRDEILAITMQILDALICLKSRSIVHCDIKPENIMFVNSKGTNVKLIDFGLATFEHSAEKPETICTEPYRCPENILELEWSYGADIWSLGCVVCEMVRREPLFDGDGEWLHLCEIEAVLDGASFPNHIVRKKPMHFDATTGKVDRTKLSAELMEKLKEKEKQKLRDMGEMTEMVKQMLAIDPSMRITAEEAFCMCSQM